MGDTRQLITIEPKQKANACIIWLHGLGASNDDFVPLATQLQANTALPLRCVFPQAPLCAITINGGISMPAWYDILGFGFGVPEDTDGITRSSLAIYQLIAAQQATGIPAHRIILAGFSQGGAIALHTGLRYPHALAGILALSTYLPLADRLPLEAHTNNQKTPIFMVHGTHDTVILPEWAEKSKNVLQQLSYPVDWRTYPMNHSVIDAEVHDITTTLTHWLS